MEAGPLLRQIRREHGLGQADLARRSGTTQTYISRIERGAVSPSVSTLARLLHAMGRRLQLSSETLTAGNMSAHELRADFRDLTAAERLGRTIALSAYLTDVAAAAARDTRADHASA